MDPGLKNVTSLAQLIHRLKDGGRDFRISWRIIRKAMAYKRGGGSCNLCVSEAYIILRGGALD